MIREASIYVLKKLGEDERAPYGLRVLTMRKWPRGVRRCDIDLWIPSAGPSIESLVALHTGKIGWDDFLAAYRMYQQDQQTCRVVSYEDGRPAQQDYGHRSLDHLHLLEQTHRTVTLLCWEQHHRCHRYTLKAMLEEKERVASSNRCTQSRKRRSDE